MASERPVSSEMLKGTLDMMILRTLVVGDAHGHTIAKVIERSSEDVLEVEQGSLYPALHRLENRGWVKSYWGTSENNRKAKFYRLTLVGRRQLTVETNQGTGSPIVTFEQKGEQLTGTFHSQIFGDAKLTGTVKGNVIEFNFVGDAGGEKIKVEYNGTIESATTMKGTRADSSNRLCFIHSPCSPR